MLTQVKKQRKEADPAECKRIIVGIITYELCGKIINCLDQKEYETKSQRDR
jgi:hypothetical protein